MNTARAEELYNEALALTDANRHAEACPKYAESQKLDPALGTQFNLADCYEHTGKLGSAYANFSAVQRAASAAGKANLAKRARDRISALESKVARVTIVLGAALTRDRAGAGTDVIVRVDGSTVAEDALAASTPLDAGEHTIDVTAAGRKPWHQTITVVDGAPLLRVEVPALLEVDRLREDRLREDRLRDSSEQPPARRPSTTFRVAGAAAAGLGLIGITIGAISGANAVSNRNLARDTCKNPDPNFCHDPSGVPIWNDANSAATISTIGFISGAILLVGGAVLWFAAPSRPVPTGRADGRGATIGVSGILF